MKRMVSAFAVICLLFSGSVYGEELDVGMVASEWQFEDAEKSEFTMASWDGRVLNIIYVDPDVSDLNEHYADALKKAKDDGRLTDESYKGIGIADCAATWKPNFAIRAIAGKKAKKFKTVILFDLKASLRKAWGLKKNTSNVILLDKKRVVRAIVRGRVPDEQVPVLVQLAIDLQNE
jgi:predicted transcriptional regulator